MATTIWIRHPLTNSNTKPRRRIKVRMVWVWIRISSRWEALWAAIASPCESHSISSTVSLICNRAAIKRPPRRIIRMDELIALLRLTRHRAASISDYRWRRSKARLPRASDPRAVLNRSTIGFLPIGDFFFLFHKLLFTGNITNVVLILRPHAHFNDIHIKPKGLKSLSDPHKHSQQELNLGSPKGQCVSQLHSSRTMLF